MEDRFLISFGLGERVEVVEGDQEENDPFMPAEVLTLAHETADNRPCRGQHGKPELVACRTKGRAQKRRHEVDRIDQSGQRSAFVPPPTETTARPKKPPKKRQTARVVKSRASPDPRMKSPKMGTVVRYTILRP